MGLRDELRQQWRTGGVLVRLILVNVAVFLALRLVGLICFLFKLPDPQLVNWLMSTSEPNRLLHTPWTVVTYMFTHYALGHVFFNMLMLWFSGRLFLDLLGGKRLLGNYLLGGLSGLVMYVMAYNLFPAFNTYAAGSTILGASAAVMGVFIGIAAYRPDMLVNLIFLGEVRLKWIAIAYVAIDLISVGADANSGGHIAHLGGALYGYLAARQLTQGRDWSLSLVNWLDRVVAFLTFQQRGRMRVEKSPRRKQRIVPDTDFNAQKRAKQQRVDTILDKISRSGYDSLTKEERDILFKASHEK